MMFFKFLPARYALNAIIEKRLKVSRLLELNDPADCRPTLWQGPQSKNEEERINFEGKYFAELHENIGMVSFSKAIYDPVIWSHYADCHKGIALGYDFQTGKIDALGFGQGIPKLHEVKYKKERAKINFLTAEEMRKGRTGFGNFINKIIVHGFTTKAPSWSYEKEYRMFVGLGPPNTVIDDGHYFLTGIGCPDRVVLGVNCPLKESDIKRALVQATGNTADALQISKAKPMQHSYDLYVD